MKRLLTILSLVLVVLSANAQHRIYPMRECNQNTYAEVIKLIDKIEKTSFIERMEGVQLNNEVLYTYGGEILLRKDGNNIVIIHREFTDMLEKHIMNHHHRAYNINNIRTELYIQNVRLFEYISEYICRNRNIKNMYINTNTRTGAAYIQIEYNRL